MTENQTLNTEKRNRSMNNQEQAKSVRCAKEPAFGDRLIRNYSKWRVIWRTVGGQVVDEVIVEAENKEEAEGIATERCSWEDRGTTFRPFRLNVTRA